jgi:nucleoside-diphosphate-sugar epimerase
MRVFVAGATGAIGRPAVRRLVADGHEVTGMTRRQERVEGIRQDGAEAVVCDVFDAERLREVVAEAKPEVVVHLLTALPARFRPRSDYLAATNRVRTAGTRNLVAAARAAGARRIVAESVALFYRPEGDLVKDEEASMSDPGPGRFGRAIEALADLERQVLGAEGIDGVVLRLGWLYGPGTYYGRDGSQAEDTLKRRSPVVGAGTGVYSFIHVDDAAAAVLAAVERGVPGAYNVVDDEPAPLREWLPLYAEVLGAKPPRRLPAWLVRLVAGGEMTDAALKMRGAANGKIKRELGWQPAFPSWREGFPASLGGG